MSSRRTKSTIISWDGSFVIQHGVRSSVLCSFFSFFPTSFLLFFNCFVNWKEKKKWVRTINMDFIYAQFHRDFTKWRYTEYITLFTHVLLCIHIIWVIHIHCPPLFTSWTCMWLLYFEVSLNHVDDRKFLMPLLFNSTNGGTSMDFFCI